MIRAANDALRFFLELATLVAVAYWGWWEARGALRWVLAFAAPIAVSLVWGRFLAPKASRRVGDPWRLVLEVLIFGAAVAALARADDPVGAVVLAILVAIHLASTFALRQRT
jgi:hypothetical protein